MLSDGPGRKKIKRKRVAGPEGGEEEMGVLPFSSENWQNKKADFLTEPEVKLVIAKLFNI